MEGQPQEQHGPFTHNTHDVGVHKDHNPSIGVSTTHFDPRIANPPFQTMDPLNASINQHIRVQQEHHSVMDIHSTKEPSFMFSAPQHTHSTLSTLSFFLVAGVDIIIRQLYLYMLFRMPALYYSRVEQVLAASGLTLEEIKYGTLATLANDENIPAPFKKLTDNWRALTNHFMEELRTLNVVSGLVVAGVLTLFQVAGAAGNDPVTRYLAFWSLFSALLSLLYGTVLIMLLSSVMSVYAIAELGLRLIQNQNPFWNVWVMLALPATWLAWSILVFIISLVWFMWRTHTDLPDDFHFHVTQSTEQGFRIFISIVLGIGLVYGILILIAASRYGNEMNYAWRRRVDSFAVDRNGGPIPPPSPFVSVSTTPTPAQVPVQPARPYGDTITDSSIPLQGLQDMPEAPINAPQYTSYEAFGNRFPFPPSRSVSTPSQTGPRGGANTAELSHALADALLHCMLSSGYRPFESPRHPSVAEQSRNTTRPPPPASGEHLPEA